ncbi:MAG: XdhC family protein, partial [Saprospiraceae bacterium]
MKEKRDIINSYDLLLQNGKRSALATVVHVEGSSYRRPGARMLISEDGHLTGAISGGCLEGDAMRKALLVINAQVPALVTYDTMDEDDAIIGIGLGCNGIIQILIEPIDPKYHINPVEIIKSIYQKRQNTVMATFFSWKDKKRSDVGTKFFIDQDGNIHGYLPQLFDSESIQSHAAEVIQNKQNVWIDVARDGEEMTAFLEFIPPPMTLVIAGAGNDVIPLADMADILGWKTIIVDGRANYARKDRFSKSCDVLLAKP